MRCYLVDELTPETLTQLEKRFMESGYASGVERLFWIPLTEEQLLPVQREHAASCGPHRLAVELLDDAVRLEFLVRAMGKMRCECVAYPAPETERIMMAWLDEQIEMAEAQVNGLQ